MAYRPQIPMGGVRAGGLYPVPAQQASFVPAPMMVVPGPMGRPMAPLLRGIPPPGGMVPPIMVGVPGQAVAQPDITKVPVPNSTSNMKVATTVFVGNISEKASDTLIRQILLRCGPVEGWKRVQDASGKLQGFGFCEYSDPDSTLRALRLLNDLKMGEKKLVAKVDAKTRKDLLKYLITKKLSLESKTIDEEKVTKEVEKLEEDKDVATAALVKDIPKELMTGDKKIQELIDDLLKGYSAVLSSSKSNEDVQRERDVKESILFMAKQSGSIDANSTLEDMDMEDGMKTLVSDEIKRFRESYQRQEDAAKEKKRERSKASNIVSTLKDIDVPPRLEREREKEKDREKDGHRSTSRSVSPRKESQSPKRRHRNSRRSRSRSPIVHDKMEREKRRELTKQKEKERMMKDDEEYEERNRQRKIKERENLYKKRLAKWQERERRKDKEHEKERKHEKERRDDMARERKHLRDFLAEYDDEKDDQKYYKGTAYARRYRDRELEVESDERDRMREKDEMEELRLRMIEEEAQKMISEGKSSSGDESAQDDEDDKDVPVAEMEDDIPLTKTGYPTIPPAYPPIQVQSAPSVDVADKPAGFQPMPMTEVISDSSVNTSHRTPREEEIRREQLEEMSNNSASATNSPSQPKLVFGLKKQGNVVAAAGSSQPSKLGIFTSEDNDIEEKPKKKLVPIEYSDEEDVAPNNRSGGRSHDGRRRNRDSDDSQSPKSSRRSRHSSSGHSGSRGARGDDRERTNDLGLVNMGQGGAGDGILGDDVVRDRKLTPDERKRVVQQLVNNIPTAKEEVFKYSLRWNQIDKVLIEKRVKPWINKKIMDYIGEQEPILTDFICNKLSCHISPGDILNDIAMVLDDDAEVFIVKLWRLLIYETEAKHLGIAKNYSEKTY